MDVQQFASKWHSVTLSERAASHSHFIDLCALVGHPDPVSVDPTGTFFTFEKGVTKQTGGAGWADVWYKAHFAWQYKGKHKHKDLNAAFRQLILYAGPLENPPLLVVCDVEHYEVHTNFNDTVKRVYRFTNAELASAAVAEGCHGFTALAVVRALFEDPQRLRPNQTTERLTTAAAELLGRLANELAQARLLTTKGNPQVTDEEISHFIMRVIFCFFASDVGLLPKESFSDVIAVNRAKPDAFKRHLGQLFSVMKTGGEFNMRQIPHFNGGLFNSDAVPDLITEHIITLQRLDALDWSDIEPSIFGTLFERILDPTKRKQLGAHYTSRADIELILRPVLLAPLLRDWDAVKTKAEPLLALPDDASRKTALKTLLAAFLKRLGALRILDPACGSGNFLYVSMALLKELEREVLAFAGTNAVSGLKPVVHPRQLFGIELNTYAWELASVVVWIGYLQWKYRNAIELQDEDPILQPLNNVVHMDAVLNTLDPKHPFEPTWPKVDVIVGNPPFSGGKKMRRDLTDAYVDALFDVWDGRVPKEADFCTYWFEKARAALGEGAAKRAGLLATQGIRGGANRKVLEKIEDTGGIFWAQSDRPWILDGAAVHVSMVGFDAGAETGKELDGLSVPVIHSNLKAGSTNVTEARRLKENLGIAFMGDTKGGKFEVTDAIAKKLLVDVNPDHRSNADVVRPWVNGSDLSGRPRMMWIVDFPSGTSEEEAALYAAPFAHVKKHVKPSRRESRTTIETWWMHERPRPQMRAALEGSARYLATPRVTKHRVFVWVQAGVVPDSATIAFARSDDFFFGVLQSHVHELWALAMGTQLREKDSGFRYTPTTTFETFPLPSPSAQQAQEVSKAAKRLNDLREGWLNPPPDTLAPSQLKKRTLTNLYNEQPDWLRMAHAKLNTAVLDAYGWPADTTDEALLARLLKLNLEREAAPN